MYIMEMTKEQREALLNLLDLKAKELIAWAAALQSSKRIKEYKEIEELCGIIRNAKLNY